MVFDNEIKYIQFYINGNKQNEKLSVVEINNRKTPESYKPTMSKILANSNSVDIDRQF